MELSHLDLSTVRGEVSNHDAAREIGITRTMFIDFMHERLNDSATAGKDNPASP